MSGSDPASLPPDLARKVLGADLRNIVKKAGDGGTLTDQERKLVRKFLDEKIDPEELLESRRNALLQMWATGRKLSPDEFAEIADHLPAGAVVRIPTEEALAAPSKPTGQYPHKLAHYAPIYEQVERTIKRWIGKGRKAGDCPPLDSPVDMPAWFARHHKHRVPQVLLDLAAKSRDASAPALPPPAEAAPPPSYRPPSVLPVGSGFEAELQRVRDEARKAAGILADAEEGKVPSEIDSARRKYESALKLLREYERDAPKILAGMGNLVDRSVEEAILLAKHGAIRADFEAMYSPALDREIMAGADYDTRRRAHLAAIHHVLRYLSGGGFGDRAAFALEAA
jgi:hypothetical protein